MGEIEVQERLRVRHAVAGKGVALMAIGEDAKISRLQKFGERAKGKDKYGTLG
jgi:hypothetical protein